MTDKTKPNFDCVLIATDAQKNKAKAIYSANREDRKYEKIDFEGLKFLPHRYFFNIGVEDDNDKYDDSVYKLECDKTIGELKKMGLTFHIGICDSEGTWYDDGRESVLNSLVCPSILTAGGGEGMLECYDYSLTVNDVVAFLERRGMKYLDNIWQKVDMINFRETVNDQHIWAFPNPDLTPTKEQMWHMIKRKHMTSISMYKNYLDTDMMTWYVNNNDSPYTKEFKEELRARLITDEKQKIDESLSLNSDNSKSTSIPVKPANKV